jgi:GST-like protein
MSPPTLRVHSTRGCRALPRVLFALEEAAAAYEVVTHDNGHFMATHGRQGPLLEDETCSLFEPNAILRHVARTRGALWPREPAREAAVDMWMDYSLTALRPALLAWAGSAPSEERLQDLVKVLAVIDRHLEGRVWLANELTVADLAYASLTTVPPITAAVTRELPRAAAWLDALAGRPAWQRAQAAAANQRTAA